jgi:hypothetical protein
MAGWECANCGQYKDNSEYDDDGLVCRACEVLAVHEREFRGGAADDIAGEMTDDEDGGDA